jgi:hypothetical protein
LSPPISRKAFESSQSDEPDTAVLDRVRELRTELQSVEAELGQLDARSAPAARKVSPERVRRYLAKLRKRVEERADYQRVLFQELEREHDFQVRVSPTGREFTASLALPSAELEEEGATGRQESKSKGGSGREALDVRAQNPR